MGVTKVLLSFVSLNSLWLVIVDYRLFWSSWMVQGFLESGFKFVQEGVRIADFI